jgi:hypothetical protein
MRNNANIEIHEHDLTIKVDKLIKYTNALWNSDSKFPILQEGLKEYTKFLLNSLKLDIKELENRRHEAPLTQKAK